MSQPTGGPSMPTSGKPRAPPKTFARSCAIPLGAPKTGGYLGGKDLGIDSDIATEIRCHRTKSEQPWMGFSVFIPLGPNNEDEGFGAVYKVNPGDNYALHRDQRYRLNVKFPLDGLKSEIKPLPQEYRPMFPKAKTELSILKVYIEGQVEVEGLGMPFANPGHPAEAWVKALYPAGAVSGTGDAGAVGAAGGAPNKLLDIIIRKDYVFVIDATESTMRNEWTTARQPPAITYPYGHSHSWDLERQRRGLLENKGFRFAPSWSFKDDQAHVTVLAQSQVQDIMWLYEETEEIEKTKFSAYFIDTPGLSYQYAIIALGADFLSLHETSWRKLQESPLRIQVENSFEPDCFFPAQIVSHPEMFPIPAFSNDHPTTKTDVVVRVHVEGRHLRFLKKFGNRQAAEAARNAAHKANFEALNRVTLLFDPQLQEYKRKVDAVSNFLPTAPATNEEHFRVKTNTTGAQLANLMAWRKSVHRALLRAQGFYHVPKFVDQGPQVQAMSQLSLDNNPAKFKSLPDLFEVNLLSLRADARETNISVPKLHEALLEQVLLGDRARFFKYFSEAPVGLGIISAGAGFGKTTALSVATLAMAASEGPVFASAPTDVAIDNFAHRLDLTTIEVTTKYNKSVSNNDPQLRRKMVVRAHKLNDELGAFRTLMADPRKGDDAAPVSPLGLRSTWKLSLSCTYWLLIALGCPHVRQLHPNDSAKLHEVREMVNNSPSTGRLAKLFRGEITQEQYYAGQIASKEEVMSLLEKMIEIADILGATPSLSHHQQSISKWKNSVAAGIAVDEAASMCRPDLYDVWGNSLLPCIMAGDEKQLVPAVLTLNLKDADGNGVNRFDRDASISALAFFKGTGWPVFELKTQFRMAVGQFAVAHREMYSDISFTYASSCDPRHPMHSAGRNLEAFLVARFGSSSPALAPAGQGSSQPAFIHCENTECLLDRTTQSKQNPGQVKVALDFLRDFLNSKNADPSKIMIITPYPAMIDTIARMRKNPMYSVLHRIPPASTIDSMQGQECDISVIIMGATKATGPGLTSDENRLNVMLTRHRSGMVIFGDIDVFGEPPPTKGKGQKKTKGKGAPKDESEYWMAGGDWKPIMVRAVMLRNLLKNLKASSRVAKIPGPTREVLKKMGF